MFTDDDLKRWSEQFRKHHDEQGLALLARLEAAERGMFSLETVIRWMREEERYERLSAADLVWLQGAEIGLEAWRKACGK
jgi:hypothetical protein